MNIEFVQKDLGLRLTIAQELMSTIYTLVTQHFPKEFGGVLMGNYSSDGLEANVTSIITPTSYVSKTTLFKRNAKDINYKIKTEYDNSNGNVIYLGEWHSHPNGSSLYSAKDFNTMIDISSQKDVQVICPLLLIVGFISNKHTPSFYVMSNKKLYNYELC